MAGKIDMTLRYERDRDLADRFLVSRNTIWRWAREGRLPQPVRLGPGCTRWRLSDVEAFVASRG
ncbi:helix-turn-helix domain-containing protein [Salinisphaera shabanensis]|uniref:helix-turn-helix transcriptional regulator n=2 Tax=Salinisphaera TaxID=180541 RepID=UPI0019308F69